ncbi:MAG TPA: hypothetical protein VIN71_07755 [Pseudomonadales bacterium]
MKTTLLPLALGLSAAAGAVDIGAPDLTGDASAVMLGASYYYDESSWDTGSAHGDRILDTVKREGIMLKMAVDLHERLQVIGKIGSEDMQNDPANTDQRVSFSGDSFVGVGIKAIAYRDAGWLVGPFVQYTAYSDHTVRGTMAEGLNLKPLDVDITSLSSLEAGLAASYAMDKLGFFGGLYVYDNNAEVRGSYDGQFIRRDIEEDGSLGAWLGMNYALTSRWQTTAELHVHSGAGLALGINYLVK